MNEKILNLYNLLDIVFTHKENGVITIYSLINDDLLRTIVNINRFAKFLINDFKSLENKFGNGVYNIDSKKLITLFGISEEHQWFTRKELVEFIETKIISVGG